MPLLVEYRLLDKLKVINEGTGPNKKLKVKGKFQKCDEQNNNGRTYPRKVLESQVSEIQEKIKDRALVGALDHPPNDAIHLSQASHLITKLWVEANGDVMGEAEILSTPSGKIVEALLNDGVKIGISSRGLGTISELKNAKVVNEDFKLITFDLVSDPSTKGAFPELTEATRLNSEKAQNILTKMKKDKILLTALEQKINEAIVEARKPKLGGDPTDAIKDKKAASYTGKPKKGYDGKRPTAATVPSPTTDIEDFKKRFAARMKKPQGKFKESKIAAEMAKVLKESISKKSKGGNQLFNNFNKANGNVKGKGRKAVDGHLQGSKPTKK